jgi:nucleotide-binding universal stress UspA family protein
MVVNHILVPLDGSSLAECVLPHTVAVARALNAQVTLLRALGRENARAKTGAVDPLNWHMRKSEAEAYLSNVAERLEATDLVTRQVVAEGSAAGRIIGYARDEDVGLIIISSHGRSGLSEWNINSVVQKVILRAYTPTLIVRAYQPFTEGLTDLQYDRLLVPLDGSKRAECVLPWATNLAGFHHCKLLLTHVVNKPEVPRHAPLTEEESELVQRLTALNREEAERYLDELRARLSPDVETRLLVSDHAAATLHSLVEKEEVDLVLLAAHGYSGGAQWPYGSIALNFIAYGTTPLFIMQDISAEEAKVTPAEQAASEYKGH